MILVVIRRLLLGPTYGTFVRHIKEFILLTITDLIRIISINTVYWYKTKYVSYFIFFTRSMAYFCKYSFWLYDSDTLQYAFIMHSHWFTHPLARRPDPNGVLAFLIQELQAAEDAGQRAWIIGHMPPGGPDTLNDQVIYSDVFRLDWLTDRLTDFDWLIDTVDR